MNKRYDEQRFQRAEEQMEAAIKQLPQGLTAAYREACRDAPKVVEKESNPRWFLRFHNFDGKSAALRLAKYWTGRKEIFQERYLLNIDLSGNGAMTNEDIQILRTGYFVNLPQDKRRRSVLYVDMSRKNPAIRPSPRTIFFALQCVMENETSRQDCFVILFNISNPFSANFVMPNLERAKFLMDDCMLVRSYRFQIIHIPPADTNVDQTFIETIYAWAMDRLGVFGKESIVPMVVSSKEECLAKLMEYELSPEGLPVSLGGSWTAGCEPWRKGCKDGDDELSLEIELDLSCLFRNTLWCHSQTVAKHQQHKSSSSSSSSSSSHGKAPPSMTQYAAAVESPDGHDGRKPFAKQQSSSSPLGTSAVEREHASKKPAAVHHGSQNSVEEMDTSPFLGGDDPPASASVAATTSYRIRQLPEHLLQTQTQGRRQSQEHPSPSPVAAAAATAATAATASAATRPKHVETEEEKEKRRKRDIVYAKRKRERKKIEIQVLNEERVRLSTSNQELQAEGHRLEELLRTAEQEVERNRN